MKVIITAGGTGGHIYPALAILEKIKKENKDSEFLFIGTHNRMENTIVPSRNIPFKSIKIYGFNSKNIFTIIRNFILVIKAYYKSKKIIKDFKPDIVIGSGGYVTLPVIKAANKLGYKTLIHEQNSIPGKTNKYLAKYCNKVAVSFDSSANYFAKDKVILTGNPCGDLAKSVTKMDKSLLKLSDNKKLVLIVMGSLGSSKMNDFFYSNLDSFKNKDYEVVIVTGKDYYNKVNLSNIPSNIKVFPYIEDMTRLLKSTDLIISRAGASTLSEIIALKIPSILIPSPYVANNHQYYNAKSLFDNDACFMIEENKLNIDLLINSIDSILDEKSVIDKMKDNLSKLDTIDSMNIIYDCINKLVSEK